MVSHSIKRVFRSFSLILLLVLCNFFCQNVLARATADSSAGMPATDMLDNMLAGGKSDSLSALNNEYFLMVEIEKNKTFIAQEQYHRESLIHRKNTFHWQYRSTRITFYVVLLIVISGIVYSGIQFFQSMREVRMKERVFLAREAAQKNNSEALPEILQTKTDMELSMKGIKVSSSLIGILVLLISIAFFYLYLIYVYPIDQMRVDTERQKKELLEQSAKE